MEGSGMMMWGMSFAWLLATLVLVLAEWPH